MIYEPREDSFLLEKHVKKLAKGKVLDMGTGSGILGLAAKEAEAAKTKEAAKRTSSTNQKADITAADINPEAVKEVKKLGIKAITSDLFQNIKEKYDLIIFNPPYLPEDKDESKASKLTTSGGKQGHEIIEKFLKQAKHHLKKEGKILLLYSSLTGDVKAIIKEQGYNFKLLEEKHMFFETLYVCLISL